jgi:hypothetical protein
MVEDLVKAHILDQPASSSVPHWDLLDALCPPMTVPSLGSPHVVGLMERHRPRRRGYAPSGI